VSSKCFEQTSVHPQEDLYVQFYGIFYAAVYGVPGGNVSILGGHSIGHSKQKSLYVHVSYSERFQR
jgi:hypothetical protein